MRSRSISGEVATGTLLLVVLAGIVVGLMAPKPKFLDARSREASKSAAASAEVERRVKQAVEAEHAKGAVVAASVQQIGVAVGQLPESPQKTFIARETGIVIPPLLPAPDPAALLAAERRRVAILEGRLEEADKLYSAATRDNAALLARATKSEARLVAAIVERREVDTQLAESAAFARGKDAVIGVLLAVAVLCVVGWIFARLNGLSIRTLGMMSADIRAGHDPQEVLDRYVPVRLWNAVKRERKRAEVEATS